MIPLWIVPEQWRELNPPAHVLKLGEVRSAENYLAALRSLHITTAPRYQPDAKRTWCNIALADGAAILRAPIPHVWDIGDGKGWRELRANDIVDGLRTDAFPGWSPEKLELGSCFVWGSNVSQRASLGLPTIATWRNSKGSGHVVFVVPTPAGKTGVYVTGAGRHCVDQCPIAQAFGSHVNEVEYWGHP